LVARLRVVVPARERRYVHGAQLPLPQRIVDARSEAPLLFLHPDFEPGLDQGDTAVDHPLLRLRALLEETLVLFAGAESHHVLDTGTIVPAAVEDHDFAGGREVPDVSLHVHLALFAIGRCRQGRDPEDPRTDPLGDCLDDAALTGCVAALE